MDGCKSDRMTGQSKIRRTGLLLLGLVLALVTYSLAVITTRGRLAEPTGLTRWQRIWRGM